LEAEGMSLSKEYELLRIDKKIMILPYAGYGYAYRYVENLQ